MNEISKTAIVAGLGTAAVAFIGYCLYFDRKRRSDPEYKKKVRDRKFFGALAIVRATPIPYIFLCNLSACVRVAAAAREGNPSNRPPMFF